MDIIKTIKSSSGIKADEYKSAIEKLWQLVDDYIADQSNLQLVSQFKPDNVIKSNFLKLKPRKKINGNDISTILKAYFEFKQENDLEIIQKFKDTFDFKKHELLYFIPRDIIYDEITRINTSKDVRVNPISFFKVIEYHFQCKVINVVFLHFKIESKNKSGKNYSELHNSIFRIYRNYKNSMLGKSSVETIFEFINFTDELLDLQSSEQIIPEIWQMVLDESQGKTEKTIIKELLETSFYYKCSKNKFYQEIFPLIKIILPDQSLLTEDEFLKSSLQSQAFNADYKRYQANKIQKIITSKS